MKTTVKQCIVDRLRATKRENIETVIEYMNTHGFFTRHCRSHHRYDGGLADHAWQTYLIALRLAAENRAQNPDAPMLSEDSIAITALLHDFCNCSGMYEITGRAHGSRSARMLKELGLKLPIEEFLAIRFHMMSSKSRKHFLFGDAEKSLLCQLVHKADHQSAKLYKGSNEPRGESDDFTERFVAALGALGIKVIDDVSGEELQRDELIDYLQNETRN